MQLTRYWACFLLLVARGHLGTSSLTDPVFAVDRKTVSGVYHAYPGQSVNLECTATGVVDLVDIKKVGEQSEIPGIDFSEKSDESRSTPLSPTKGHVKIVLSAVTRADEGHYNCTAREHGTGATKTSVINFLVDAPVPDPRSSKSSSYSAKAEYGLLLFLLAFVARPAGLIA